MSKTARDGNDARWELGVVVGGEKCGGWGVGVEEAEFGTA